MWRTTRQLRATHGARSAPASRSHLEVESARGSMEAEDNHRSRICSLVSSAGCTILPPPLSTVARATPSVIAVSRRQSIWVQSPGAPLSPSSSKCRAAMAPLSPVPVASFCVAGRLRCASSSGGDCIARPSMPLRGAPTSPSEMKLPPSASSFTSDASHGSGGGSCAEPRGF